MQRISGGQNAPAYDLQGCVDVSANTGLHRADECVDIHLSAAAFFSTYLSGQRSNVGRSYTYARQRSQGGCGEEPLLNSSNGGVVLTNLDDSVLRQSENDLRCRWRVARQSRRPRGIYQRQHIVTAVRLVSRRPVYLRLSECKQEKEKRKGRRQQTWLE